MTKWGVLASVVLDLLGLGGVAAIVHAIYSYSPVLAEATAGLLVVLFAVRLQTRSGRHADKGTTRQPSESRKPKH